MSKAKYIRALQATGTPIGSAIIIAAAKGIVMSNDHTQLAENCGHKAQVLMKVRGKCYSGELKNTPIKVKEGTTTKESHIPRVMDKHKLTD